MEFSHGAGTNFKVGTIFCHDLHFFGSTSIIGGFDERFCDGQYSKCFCLLFFYSRCPHAQPFEKVGGGQLPRALWGQRHCVQQYLKFNGLPDTVCV